MDVEREVFKQLLIELDINDNDEKSMSILKIKVKNAIRDVKNRRSYPSHFTETDIQHDIEKLYSNIHDLALYDFNQIGVEGQVSHSDNTNSRVWKNREECFKGVFAWAGF